MGSLVNRGWVKLWREMLSKAIWSSSSPEQKTVLITILLLANHEKNEWIWKGEKYSCEAGQLITSLRSLQESCGDGVSMQNVRTALVKFEKLGFLTCESTKTGRLITIVNWAKYQSDDRKANKASNKEVTKHSQSTNKELTTNKNDKNDKKDENDIYGPPAKHITHPSVEEVKAYCEERGNGISAERFVRYYEMRDWMLSRGKKLTDWKAAVRYWETMVEDEASTQDPEGHPDQRKDYIDVIDYGL